MLKMGLNPKLNPCYRFRGTVSIPIGRVKKHHSAQKTFADFRLNMPGRERMSFRISVGEGFFFRPAMTRYCTRPALM